MTIGYLMFEVQLSRLSIEKASDVERIRQAIVAAVHRIDLDILADAGLEVDLAESAGKPSIGELPT